MCARRVGQPFGIVARNRRPARDDSEVARARDISQTSKHPATTTPGEHEAMRRFEERIGRLIPIDTEGVTPPQSAHDDHIETHENIQQNTTQH